MAVDGRIPVRHEDVFTQPVMFLSVESVDDFDKAKVARESGRAMDVQERDKETGQRLWAVSVIDPTARAGQREIKVKIAADVQPVPTNGPGGSVEFEGLLVIPYVDTNRQRPRLGIAYRAGGFRTGAGKATAKAA